MADNMNTKQPLICIGREYGSGGREIAEKLAEKLGIPCYDKLLIHKAAEKSGYTEHFLTQNEEQPFSIGSLLTGNPFADTVSMAHAFYPESQMAFDAERHARVLRLDVQQDKGTLAEIRPELHDRISIQFAEYETVFEYKRLIAMQRNRFVR